MNNWYDCIEEPIRPLVKLLRDNGYNTFCSCGHEMYVECEYYHETPTALWNLLVANGYRDFKIEITIYDRASFGRREYLVIWLPKPNGRLSEFGLHKGSE